MNANGLLVSVLFRRPLTFIILVGGISRQGGIKMASAKSQSANELARTSLPARASEQGNVIGSVRIYMCVYIIERTRDLIYLKFVATDFFPKIISLNSGERRPCYSAVSDLLMNPLPDRSNYSPL